MNNTAPTWATTFADRIEKTGMDRLDAITDIVDHAGHNAVAVFIRVLPMMTYEEARLAAERAISAATWSFARSTGYGVILDTSHPLSRRPEYLVGEVEDGAIVFAWINAATITNAAEFERVRTAATAAASEYRTALETGTWPVVQWGLTHPGRRPSYKVQSLIPDPSDPIRALLKTLDIN